MRLISPILLMTKKFQKCWETICKNTEKCSMKIADFYQKKSTATKDWEKHYNRSILKMTFLIGCWRNTSKGMPNLSPMSICLTTGLFIVSFLSSPSVWLNTANTKTIIFHENVYWHQLIALTINDSILNSLTEQIK